MTEKRVFEDISRIVLVLNKHMDEKRCLHELRAIIAEVFEE